jgi:hypothetical protein
MVDLFIRSAWITETGSKVDCTIVYSNNELGTPPLSQDLAGGAWWVEEFLRGLGVTSQNYFSWPIMCF